MLLVDLFVIAVMAVGLAALGFAGWYAFRWSGRWRVAALLPAVLLLLWAGSVAAGWPSEHTLWPFELLLLGPMCATYVLVLRAFHGRSLKREKRNGTRQSRSD